MSIGRVRDMIIAPRCHCELAINTQHANNCAIQFPSNTKHYKQTHKWRYNTLGKISKLLSSTLHRRERSWL